MASDRNRILSWAEQRAIAPERVADALRVAGVLPDASAWHRLADRLLLWMGAVMVAAGVSFFIAYNWADLGRYAKFAMVDAPLVAALALVWWRRLDRVSGQAALVAAAVLTGVLLALIGQTYQTGADTFELFGAWAVAILPWAVLGRFAPLWILWLALVNLATALYYQAFGALWFLRGGDAVLWALFAIDTAALLVWEALAMRGVRWLQPRWAPRLLATAGGAFVTVLAVWSIVDRGTDADGVLAWVVWAGALAAAYWGFRPDLYMLAGGWLTLIVVVATFLGHNLLRGSDGGAFLFIGLVVIGLAAAGGIGLRKIAEAQAQ